MRRLLGLILVGAAAMLLLQACGAAEDAINDLTSQTENVDVELPAIGVTGTPAAGRLAFAVLQACPAAPTSLDALLAMTSGWDTDWESHLDGISIKEVAYQITGNTTPGDVSLSLQVTDPETESLAPVGSTVILANTDTPAGEWIPLPLSDSGKAIVQYYLNNRGEMFDYCAEADPDDPALSLTVWFRLNVDVEVTLL